MQCESNNETNEPSIELVHVAFSSELQQPGKIPEGMGNAFEAHLDSIYTPPMHLAKGSRCLEGSRPLFLGFLANQRWVDLEVASPTCRGVQNHSHSCSAPRHDSRTVRVLTKSLP